MTDIDIDLDINLGEPVVFNVDTTYFVKAGSLKLKSKILNFNGVKKILLLTESSGVLTDLRSLLSATITATASTAVIVLNKKKTSLKTIRNSSTRSDTLEIREPLRVTLNGCTAEMLTVLLKYITSEDEEVSESESEDEDSTEDEDNDSGAETSDSDDSDAETIDPADFEYNTLEEMSKLMDKLVNFASNVWFSLKTII